LKKSVSSIVWIIKSIITRLSGKVEWTGDIRNS